MYMYRTCPTIDLRRRRPKSCSKKHEHALSFRFRVSSLGPCALIHGSEIHLAGPDHTAHIRLRIPRASIRLPLVQMGRTLPISGTALLRVSVLRAGRVRTLGVALFSRPHAAEQAPAHLVGPGQGGCPLKPLRGGGPPVKTIRAKGARTPCRVIPFLGANLNFFRVFL